MSSYTDRAHRAKQSLLGAVLVTAGIAVIAATELEAPLKHFCFAVLLLRLSQFLVEAIGEAAGSRRGNFHERRIFVYGAMTLVLLLVLTVAQPFVTPQYHVPLLVFTGVLAIRPLTKMSDHLLCWLRAYRKERAGLLLTTANHTPAE